MRFNKYMVINRGDFFRSGKFHFDSDWGHVSQAERQRLSLTKNDWKSYGAISPRRLNVKRGRNSGSEIISIGFFCEYYDSHFFELTILEYAKKSKKIKWILCLFNEDLNNSYKKIPKGVSVCFFDSVESAISYCNNNLDFLIDADGPLRPTKALDVLKQTTAVVINYYNLIASSYQDFYDVLIVPKNVVPSPHVSEPLLIELECLGSWRIDPIDKFSYRKRFDFAIIGEQFKLGELFFRKFSVLSKNFTFIFIGIYDVGFLILKLKEYGWNMANIHLHPSLGFAEFKLYLKERVFAVIDIPNYSSGSGNLASLAVGIPTLCCHGEYWINSMGASILEATSNSEYIYKDLDSLERIYRMHRSDYINREIIIEENARRSGYFNVDMFIDDLYEKLVSIQINNR